MKHSLTHHSGETVLSIDGELDANTAPELRSTLNAIVQHGPPLVTVDLSGLRLIDSSGVGALVSLFKRVRATGSKFRIVGLTEQPRAIFRLLRLDAVLATGVAPQA
jgi:anti-sigma B factor antagonist